MPAQAPASNGTTAISKVDPRTGKVLTLRGALNSLKPPKAQEISPIGQVAGKNLPINKFEDHLDWNGMDLVTVNDPTLFAFQDGIPNEHGERSEFVTFVGWVCPPGKQPDGEAMLIRTGARNVYERILTAYMMDALPIRGTLRYVATTRGKHAIFLD